MKVAEWSPCAAPAGTVTLGPFALPAVRDCPVVGDKLPLIVISHGFGGTSLVHHDTPRRSPMRASSSSRSITRRHRVEPGQGAVAGGAGESADRHRAADRLHAPRGPRRREDRSRAHRLLRLFARRLYRSGARRCRPGADGAQGALRRPDGGTVRADRSRLGAAAADPPRAPHQGLRDRRPAEQRLPTKATLQGVSAPIDLWGSERGGDGVAPADVARVAADLPGIPRSTSCPGRTISRS